LYSFKEEVREHINSTGYVVDTLEAAVWCLITEDNYERTILKAVNLGLDTDTIAAVAGGLAGLYYGYEGIPEEWIQNIKRKDIIEECLYEKG
ncbi:MAG: ADP-ribosylglycohydrolase family protein, partial [Ruminococcus sp.]|nr:ADP-ribosylglycohydrolase family protein [Ruminococcus sp.]